MPPRKQKPVLKKIDRHIVPQVQKVIKFNNDLGGAVQYVGK